MMGNGLARSYAIALAFWIAVPIGGAPAAEPSSDDPARMPAPVHAPPGREYGPETRAFQGIPTLERARNGRLWAAWYGGGPTEGPENYVMLATRGDGGPWSPPRLVIDPPGLVRAYDPCLWVDPTGRLWLFWAQSFDQWDGRGGVWAITADRPGDEAAVWSAPRRLCDGVMMNKPIALGSQGAKGAWLLPVGQWNRPARQPHAPDATLAHDLGDRRRSWVFASTDEGATWSPLGSADVPDRAFDEHMLVERRDGSLWMLVRTNYGIGESVSTDRGKTWGPGGPSAIPHVNSRFFIRRLDSGNLLLVRHAPPAGSKARSHLTAFLSDDDGATWKGGLLLDARTGVSYPDGVQAPDGTIAVIYDHARTGDKEILTTAFTEADVAEGRPVSGKALPRVLVNQATGSKKSR